MATLDDLSPERALELSYIIEKTGIFELEKRVAALEENAGINSPSPLVPQSIVTTNARHEAYLKENTVVEPVPEIEGVQPTSNEPTPPASETVEDEKAEEATVTEQSKSLFG